MGGAMITGGFMKRYDNIQIFRVLACLGVFITHLAPRMGASGPAARAANWGASGVYLFFLISGFLACGARDIRPGGGVRGILAYYCKRLLRILPLYYAVILYNMALHCLLLKDVTPDPGGLYWLRYFLLTNAFIPAPDNFWANLSATWTISLFFVFYLLAPLLARLSGSCARAGILYVLTLLLRYVWVAAGLSSYMMIFYYLHFFVLGMLVRRLAERYRPVKAAAFFAVPAALLWIVTGTVGAGNDSFICQSWIFAEAILLTGGFRWQDTGEKEERGGLRAAAAGIFGALDRYSYAVYLIHAVVIDGIVLLQGRFALPGAAVLALAVSLTAAGARAAHFAVEKPAENLSRRLVTAIRM